MITAAQSRGSQKPEHQVHLQDLPANHSLDDGLFNEGRTQNPTDIKCRLDLEIVLEAMVAPCSRKQNTGSDPVYQTVKGYWRDIVS